MSEVVKRIGEMIANQGPDSDKVANKVANKMEIYAVNTCALFDDKTELYQLKLVAIMEREGIFHLNGETENNTFPLDENHFLLDKCGMDKKYSGMADGLEVKEEEGKKKQEEDPEEAGPMHFGIKEATLLEANIDIEMLYMLPEDVRK